MRHSLILVLFFTNIIIAQNNTSIEVNLLRGNILPHKKGLEHLITGHPEGVFVGFLKQTDAANDWAHLYDFPEYGGYFLYQNFKNEILEQNYAIGFQTNFYFLKRKLQLKTAAGVAYNTNPYNKETNSKNNAFGSTILGNVNVGLSYQSKAFFDKLHFQTGFFLSHFSNGRTKSPNSGINTINISLGVAYHLEKPAAIVKDSLFIKSKKVNEPIGYNLILRTGFNQSSVVNSGQFPFYHIGFFADKRINKKSALQLGTELFVSNFYKDFISYQAIAYPAKNIDPNTDFKRVGIFVGHELFFNKISVEVQAGYYIYQPFKFDIPIYDRVGFKYYFNKKISSGISLKTHGFLAEALEFMVAYKFI